MTAPAAGAVRPAGGRGHGDGLGQCGVAGVQFLLDAPRSARVTSAPVRWVDDASNGSTRRGAAPGRGR
jgi:hypothetical protein